MGLPVGHILPQFAWFAGCFTVVVLQYYAGMGSVLDPLLTVAAKHNCTLFEAVEILAKYKVLHTKGTLPIDDDIIMQGSGQEVFSAALDSADVPQLSAEHCSPRLRNPLGYHDAKWWDIAAIAEIRRNRQALYSIWMSSANSHAFFLEFCQLFPTLARCALRQATLTTMTRQRRLWNRLCPARVSGGSVELSGNEEFPLTDDEKE